MVINPSNFISKVKFFQIYLKKKGKNGISNATSNNKTPQKGSTTNGGDSSSESSMSEFEDDDAPGMEL